MATGRKTTTTRAAAASLPPTDRLQRGTSGDALALVLMALAGILAAKQTGALIPLCHPLSLSDVAAPRAAPHVAPPAAQGPSKSTDGIATSAPLTPPTKPARNSNALWLNS